ncbi:MAG: hypothetical protein KGI25_07445 [Thaumarchaeota archaeon]|nr:hypothetical protein [Nitrososphaerota archaeon]
MQIHASFEVGKTKGYKKLIGDNASTLENQEMKPHQKVQHKEVDANQ